MIQIYWTDEQDYINGHKDFEDEDLASIGRCVGVELLVPKNRKIVIKKIPGRMPTLKNAK